MEKSGVAALAGNLRGGVHFRQIGEFRDLGDGRSKGDFEHMFVTEDESTLRTRKNRFKSTKRRVRWRSRRIALTIEVGSGVPTPTLGYRPSSKS